MGKEVLGILIQQSPGSVCIIEVTTEKEAEEVAQWEKCVPWRLEDLTWSPRSASQRALHGEECLVLPVPGAGDKPFSEACWPVSLGCLVSFRLGRDPVSTTTTKE